MVQRHDLLTCLLDFIEISNHHKVLHNEFQQIYQFLIIGVMVMCMMCTLKSYVLNHQFESYFESEPIIHQEASLRTLTLDFVDRPWLYLFHKFHVNRVIWAIFKFFLPLLAEVEHKFLPKCIKEEVI